MDKNSRSSIDELLNKLLEDSSKEKPQQKAESPEENNIKENIREENPAPAIDAEPEITEPKVTVNDTMVLPSTMPKKNIRDTADTAAENANPFAVTEDNKQARRSEALEDRTTIAPAAHVNTAPKVKVKETTDPLYGDLDGISQTQVHKRKAPVQNQKGKKKKKKKGGMRALRSIILAAVILGISVALALVIITYGRDILGVNNDNTTKIVTIPQGADTAQIAEVLEEEGVITYPKLFKLMAGFSGKDALFTAGDHELRPDMAYDTIFENLASPSLGSKDVVNIAFPEGITLVDAAELLEEQGVCDSDAFIDSFNNKSKFGLAYEKHLPSFTNDKFYKMEGYLFPDTYQFYTNMDVDLVCQKILRNFNDKITERDYERMKELGISLDETIILASIIQREAGSLDQMTRISSVFWNRLNNPETFPKLQSDPTGGYVEDVIKPHIDSYNQEMFNSYDTYICNGLPAGAICNPGYDAISAALYPASTDYFYFYSNLNTKETYFSRTLEEHEKWIKKVEGHQYTGTAETMPAITTEPVEVGVGAGDATITTALTTGQQ